MKTRDTFSIAYTALMAALVFAATYLIKIPNPATGGYTWTQERSYSGIYRRSFI